MIRAMRLEWSPLVTPYSAEALKEEVPHHGGVYVIWTLRSSGWVCNYVAASDCLLIDMALHLVPGDDKPLINQVVTLAVAGFSVAVVHEASARAGIVAYLHLALQPTLSRDPGGMRVGVNLPEQRVLEKPRPARPSERSLFATGVAHGGATLLQRILRRWFDDP